MTRVHRHGIRPIFQVKQYTLGRGRGPMAGVVNPRQVGLAFMTRIADRHVIPIRVCHPIQTPPENLIGIPGIGDPRVGSLPKIKPRTRLVRRLEIRTAISSRQLLHPREPAFYFRPVFIIADIHQLHVDARQPEDVVVAGVVQPEFGLSVDHAFFQFPAHAHPAVAIGTVVD